MSRLVMVIDPNEPMFLHKGVVRDDGPRWKTVDVGFGEPIHIEAWKVMDADRATSIFMDAASTRFAPIVAAQQREARTA